jgi:hypothetical protein
MKIWDVHYGFRVQVPNLIVEGLHIDHVAYGVYHPNYDNHVYRNVYIGYTNTEPFNRGHDDLSVQYGALTVDGLIFDGCRSGGMPLIQISDDNPTGKAITHIRGLEVKNWSDTSKQRAIVNLGGGPRPTPNTEKGVPVIVHNWFGEGRTAMVSSVKSGEYKADPDSYKEVKDLTGNQSRAKEVKAQEFPTLLTPVDDLPPATVITSVSKSGSQLVIRGYASDNGTIKSVRVNGQEAKSTSPNFATWEITLPSSSTELVSTGEDDKGNVEKNPAKRSVK